MRNNGLLAAMMFAPLAAPMAMRRDEKGDLTALFLSRPEDCFAIEMPYNMTPP
jgi:hypothetical protein